MRIVTMLLAVSLAIAPATRPRAATAEEAKTLAVVNEFLTGFNTGDEKTLLAACAPQTTIIDDIPPHVWQGPAACREWKRAVDAFLKDSGETHVSVMLGKPSHNEVTGDRAYLVAPLTFKYEQGGKPVVDTGSLMVVSLYKTSGGWRITGWACAEHP